MVMLERWKYVYFIVFYGQSVVFCFLYTVYLTFESPHLPLPLHQCFPPHCRSFAYRGGEDFMPAKIEQVCQSRRENDHVTEIASLMEGEWSCHGGGQFNGARMVMLRRWSV